MSYATKAKVIAVSLSTVCVTDSVLILAGTTAQSRFRAAIRVASRPLSDCVACVILGSLSQTALASLSLFHRRWFGA